MVALLTGAAAAADTPTKTKEAARSGSAAALSSTTIARAVQRAPSVNPSDRVTRTAQSVSESLAASRALEAAVRPNAAPIQGIVGLKGHATRFIGAHGELRITRVERIDSGPIEPGEIVRAQVWVANSAAISATVGAASMGPTGYVQRSGATAVIPPSGQAAVRLDIPVEVAQIRDNRFSTLVGIVAVDRRSGGWLSQLWQDGNADDNVTTVAWTVDPSVYSVRVLLRNFGVHDDCDDGSEPGEWTLGFATEAAVRPWPFTIGGLPSENNGEVRPGRNRDRIVYGSGVDLHTGRTYEVGREMNLSTVSAGQMVAVYLHGGEDDGPFAGADFSCSTAGGIWLTPEQWHRGGDFTASDDKNLITFDFHLSARPVTIR